MGILNQHGIEAMLEVVHDEIYRSVEEAYNNGEHAKAVNKPRCNRDYELMNREYNI